MKLSTTAVALSATVGAGLVAAVPNAHSTIERRAPAGWTDRGCVKDSQAHLLDTLAYWGPLNSPEHCTKLCGENAYKFAGLESESPRGGGIQGGGRRSGYITSVAEGVVNKWSDTGLSLNAGQHAGTEYPVI